MLKPPAAKKATKARKKVACTPHCRAALNSPAWDDWKKFRPMLEHMHIRVFNNVNDHGYRVSGTLRQRNSAQSHIRTLFKLSQQVNKKHEALQARARTDRGPGKVKF
jgi:hypothetical protein